jgi:hypothetical protein
MRHVRAEARVRARARVCAWARPHPPRRVRALPAAAERRGLGSQAFNSASAFNANIGAWNTASVTALYRVCAALGPARTAADCARSVVDACAAVVRVADVRVHAHVAMCIRVYVDGPPMESHLRSSAIELPLHLGLSMSNAHMHRPFPRRMYPCSRIYASIARARVCACVLVCVCGGVLHACKLRESIDIQTFYQASAFNANIGAWNTARVTDSYSVCAAFGPARTAVDCARSVADACAAVARGGAAALCARLCVRM